MIIKIRPLKNTPKFKIAYFSQNNAIDEVLTNMDKYYIIKLTINKQLLSTTQQTTTQTSTDILGCLLICLFHKNQGKPGFYAYSCRFYRIFFICRKPKPA